MNESDEELVARYRRGETLAFETLVKRYESSLFRFLVRYTHDEALAQDVFQETFVQVYESLGSFDAQRRFKPWLLTIAANKARDHLRRQQRRPLTFVGDAAESTGSTHDSAGSVLDLLQSPVTLPPDAADAQEVRQRVRRIAGEMPLHLREVLVLAYFEQLPYAQIAQILGVPLGTVKSRLHAAVAFFAQQWPR